MSVSENLQPKVLQCLSRELIRLKSKPLEGIEVMINEHDMGDVQADICGPVHTPYEGGIFRVKLVLDNEFPQSPPRGYFLTKVFHPNISVNGEVCVNTLKKDWKATHGIEHIFQTIRCLLIIPFPESALNERASKMFLESYEEYFQRAKMMTGVHAAKRVTRVSPSVTEYQGKRLDQSKGTTNSIEIPTLIDPYDKEEHYGGKKLKRGVSLTTRKKKHSRSKHLRRL